jgi:UPF0042 nucleotide-binding protein
MAGKSKPATMPRESIPGQHRILLVTGLLGAGKTTALHALEDLGWETIDNFPIRLLERLLATEGPGKEGEQPTPLAIGFDSRTRGFDPAAIIATVGHLASRGDLAVTALFLDCADHELERRYNETRRPHPLAHDRPLAAGIAAERDLITPLCNWADVIIATTDLSANQLQQAMRQRFAIGPGQGTNVTVSSFGFARGTPPLADLVFDVRFLDNPHWIDALRPLTGRDEPVAEHIRRDPAFAEAFARIRDLLLLLLPRFAAKGKAYVNIAFGCTGGRHRSVFMAESIAKALRESGFTPTLLHRNLDARAADLLEDTQQA